jgi:hypothetical protein
MLRSEICHAVNDNIDFQQNTGTVGAIQGLDVDFLNGIHTRCLR